MRVEHLTDEQFTELLAGTTNDRSAELHVESCVECREELSSLSSAVADLNVASLRWAERRAVRIETPSKWALNWSVLPSWGAAVASVLVLGIALGVHIGNREQGSIMMRPPAHAVEAPSEDELAQDNSLLQSIDKELTEQMGAQVAAAQPASDAHSIRRHTPREVSN